MCLLRAAGGAARMAQSERQVVEIQCKSLLNRVVSQRMPFRWSINPYRGCEHKCVYCYARRYHTFLDLDPGSDFENKIFVKVNAPEVLRRELARPGWQREKVAIGTAVDPYQPVEGKYRLTRQILEVLLDAATPCSVVTKNTMVQRDVDLLQELARGPGCTVSLSLTTLDEDLARRLEPGTPAPRRRLETVGRLARRGIEAGVMIAPVLPGLTDGPGLERLVDEAFSHGARFVHWGVLRLDEGVKDVYLDFIRSEAPRLLPLYGRMYPGAYAPAEYVWRIDARMGGKLRAKGGFPEGEEPPRTALGAAGALPFGRVSRAVDPAGRKRAPLAPVQLQLQF